MLQIAPAAEVSGLTTVKQMMDYEFTRERAIAELAEETRATMSGPQMLTGPVEGRFLELLVHASGARRILEIGTLGGYSTIWLARGLRAGGPMPSRKLSGDAHPLSAGPFPEPAGRTIRQSLARYCPWLNSTTPVERRLG